MSQLDYEIAGFADENGDLGKPVPSGKIAVPQKIWKEGDVLRWRASKVKTREVSRRMLNEFVTLKDSDSVVRFAQNWGVLGMSGEKLLQPGAKLTSEGSEPIAAWLYYSRRAAAVLNIAAALKEGKVGDFSDWAEIGHAVDVQKQRGIEPIVEAVEGDMGVGRHTFGMGFSIVVLYPETRLNDARQYIGSEVGYWLDCWKKGKTNGLSDLALRWDQTDKKKQRWQIQIDYHGLLFPAIALQLALVVANADSLYSCSGCGDPYIRERKRPKLGQANYCDRCRGGVAQQRAVQTYRAKRADALRLHLSGKSVQEIAVELRTNTVRVQKWLKKGSSDEET
jgi:hypothetical protein